jgi:hypothetical protein
VNTGRRRCRDGGGVNNTGRKRRSGGRRHADSRRVEDTRWWCRDSGSVEDACRRHSGREESSGNRQGRAIEADVDREVDSAGDGGMRARAARQPVVVDQARWAAHERGPARTPAARNSRCDKAGTALDLAADDFRAAVNTRREWVGAIPPRASEVTCPPRTRVD